MSNLQFSQFIPREIPVQAAQWRPGLSLDLNLNIGELSERPPQLIFSASGSHYYLSAFYDEHPKFASAWLPVVEGAGEVLPFAFWEVKPGERVEAKEGDELVLRYMRYMKWAYLPAPHAVLITGGGIGSSVSVHDGDWIVLHGDGAVQIMKDDVFQKKYKAQE